MSPMEKKLFFLWDTAQFQGPESLFGVVSFVIYYKVQYRNEYGVGQILSFLDIEYLRWFIVKRLSNF